jgi:hypothetical protein
MLLASLDGDGGSLAPSGIGARRPSPTDVRFVCSCPFRLCAAALSD